jgi:hypothetical protein
VVSHTPPACATSPNLGEEYYEQPHKKITEIEITEITNNKKQ